MNHGRTGFVTGGLDGKQQHEFSVAKLQGYNELPQAIYAKVNPGGARLSLRVSGYWAAATFSPLAILFSRTGARSVNKAIRAPTLAPKHPR